MDPRRFDSLARSFAAPKTRRGLLGGLAALAAGLAGTRAGAQVSQASCGNTSCKNNPGKCNDGCVCCVFGNGNSRCMPPGTCSGTPTCPPGEVPDPILGCVTPTTTTTAAPTTTTTTTTTAPSCGSSGPCPTGQVCVNGGCLVPCPGGVECPGCSGCRCLHEMPASGNTYCGDQNIGFGTCVTTADCPSGSFCSELFTGPDVVNLCVGACCTGV